jgi:predicted O-methyltransferase YrrM
MNIDKMLNTNNWFSFRDFYKEMALNTDYKVYVELGVWKGHSISYLASNLKNRNVKIYAVDIFEDWDKNKEVLNEVQYITQIYNKNLENAGVRNMITDIKSISWEAADKFKDGEIDFIFIDADHSYTSVTKDIKAWLPKLKKGGIISGHDYFTSLGVKQAVDELLGDVTTIKKENIWFKKL